MIELVEVVNGWDPRWVLAALLGILDAWSIGLIVKARPAFRVGLLWSAIVVLCPIVGCLFWYVLGPKPVPGRPGGA